MNERPINYTVEGACAASGLGRTSLYSLIGAGKIRAVKVGSRTLIDADSLHAFLASLPAAVIRTGRRTAA